MGKYRLALFGLLWTLNTQAQVIVQQAPPPGFTFDTAPIIDCWLFGTGQYDYFTGASTNLDGPASFCGTVDNPLWLAFTSRQFSGFTLDVEASNCLFDDGIQLQVYEADFCDPIFGLIPVSTCLAQVFEGQSFSLTFSNLPPNELFYIFIDGYDGDLCDFHLNVHDTEPLPPVFPQIIGPSAVLSGQTYNYQITDILFDNPCGNIEYIDTSICPLGNPCFGPPIPIWNGPPGSSVQVNPDGSASITMGQESGLLTFDYQCLHLELFIEVDTALENCQNTFAAGNSCTDATNLCGSALNGFCGNNAGAPAASGGNLNALGLCPFENTQWLRFAPCESTAVFELAVGNCLLGNGLTMSVVQSDDCGNFSALGACYFLVAGLNTSVVVNGLTPGQWYYILIDGNFGDACDYAIQVVSGISAEVPTATITETSPGYIDGPTDVCLGEAAIFTLVPPTFETTVTSGAGCALPADACAGGLADSVSLIWHAPAGATFLSDSVDVLSVEILFNDTIDGDIWVEYLSIEDTTQVDSSGACNCLSIGAAGTIDPHHINITYTIQTEYITTNCFQPCAFGCAGAVCGASAVQVCRIDCGFLVQNIMYDDTPLFQDLGTFVYCEGQCHFYNGTNYCSSGTYSVFEITPFGCPQITTFTVSINPMQIINLGLITLCEGSCFSFGAATFCTPGFYNIPGIDPLTACPNLTLFEIQTIPTQITDLGLISLCQGECFSFAGNSYCDEGSYSISEPDPLSGCLNQTIFTIFKPVANPVLVSPPVIICNAPQTHYTLSFNLQGTPPFFVNGTSVFSNNYLSAPIETGTDYFFEIYDSSPCSSDATVILSGSYDCGPLCLSTPGQMPTDLMEICENETAIASQPIGLNLGAGDVREFILHTLPDTILGNILARSTDGNFAFLPGTMATDQVYYLSAVTGPSTAGGQVELSSLCLSVAKGQPLVFRPKPNLSVMGDTLLNCLHTAVALEGHSDLALNSIQWKGPENFVSNQIGIQANLPGLYELEVGTAAGCTAKVEQWITEDVAPPQIALGPDGLWYCNTQPQALQVEVQGGQASDELSYQWTSPNGVLQQGANSDQATVGGPGLYICEVVNLSNGCKSLDSLLIANFEDRPQSLQASLLSPACAGDMDGSIQIGSVNGGVSPFVFTLNGQPVSGQNWEPLPAGDYELVLTDANGCLLDTLLTIPPPPSLQLELGENRQLKLGEALNLEAIINFTPENIQWASSAGETLQGALNWLVQPLQNASFTLTLTDENGCEISDILWVEVLTRNQIYAPNAFSPNGDGLNDRFTLYGFSQETALVENMAIYDRWGGLIFEQQNFPLNDELSGWDGARQSKPVPAGVYIYQAIIKLVNGQTIQLAGDVAVLR